MGGNQSQEEERSQSFSTIGLPPPVPYHQQRPVRTASHSSGDSSRQASLEHRLRGREQLYKSSVDSQQTGDDDEQSDWIHVNRVPRRITQSQLPPTPPPQLPKRLPPSSHNSEPPTTNRLTQGEVTDTLDIPRPNRLRQRAATSHSLRDMEEQEFVDLSELLSTLLSGSNRSHGDRTQDQNGMGTESSERRRMHRSRHSGMPRPRLRHHHSDSAPGGPFIFLRGTPKTKCPLCSKEFTAPDFEEHLAICSTKPRVQFNVDKLTQDVGECSICLDDMIAGDEIGRLPCLCVYHLKCLREWYKKSQTCPEHPDMKGAA